MCICRCIQFNNLHRFCAQESLATNSYLNQYESVQTLTAFTNIITHLESYARLITSEECHNQTIAFICNAIFIPCDLITGEPKAICKDSCNKFSEECILEYDTIIKAAVILEAVDIEGIGRIDIEIEDFCADTLNHTKQAFGINTTNTGVECNCLAIQGMYTDSCA